MFDSVRLRLTLWHVGVFFVILVIFSSGVYVFLRAHFFERADGILRSLGSATISIMREGLSEGNPEALAAQRALAILEFPKHSITIFDDQGKLVAERPTGITARIPFSAQARNLPTDRKFRDFSVNAIDGSREPRRIAVQRVVMGPNGKTYTVMTSRSLAPVLGELYTERLLLGTSVPAGLLVAGLAGWFLSRKSMAPVLAMAERARRISAENLDQRLPVLNAHDELGQLAATFNDLLSRLSSAFAQQRQFVADASHEFRTPVSVMRTAAAVTLEKSHRSEEEYRNALAIVDVQIRRMSRIVEDMFRLARADAGRLTLELRPFYLDEVLAETSRAASILAAPKNIRVELPRLPETSCYGDEDLLRRMFMNVLENAVKYTPEGGRITVNLTSVNGWYFVSVSDTGRGIPADAQPHVFERFFRVDKERSRKEGLKDIGAGAGLGLAIARSIAEAHRGSLDLQHSDETGSTFQVTLPANRQV
jgi:heavy metal sensor kinase